MTTPSTNEETIFPNAAPTMIPTAMSMTLPLTAKVLNSLRKLMMTSPSFLIAICPQAAR